MTRKQNKLLLRIIVSGILLVAFFFVPVNNLVKFFLYLIPYLIVGYDVILKAINGVMSGEVFDEHFLMSVATIGAMVLGLTYTGDYVEAIAVMFFYQVGELLQSLAVGKSRKNIATLMDIRPDYAHVEIDGELRQVSPEEVEPGTVIVVQPGEKIPLDGIVTEGFSDLETSALTGESLPRSVRMGDAVISGCINISGVLKIKTTKPFTESTVSKILALVEKAGFNKAKSEKFISKFGKIYTPIVCCCALVVAVIPPLFITFVLHGVPDWNSWIYRALTFLVVSCPCALVISVPLTFFAGIGGASRMGILVKGSNYLESLAKVKTVVFDKTGTLTRGSFEVTEIRSQGNMSQERLLEYAAYGEIASGHPIGKSIQKAYGKKLDRQRVKNIQEKSGKGVVALVDDVPIAIGNDSLMKDLGIQVQEADNRTGTIVYVAVHGGFEGYLCIADKIKNESAQALEDLKRLGVNKTVMLTGDRSAIAQTVAEQLGIDEVYSELLPENKVEKLEKVLSEKKTGDVVAFVGDGINDAPVLMRADIGIAMGALGSDAAIEAADVVLMDDNPGKIAQGIGIARKCLNIVRQNVVFALGTKILYLILATFGFASMWYAIFADVGVTVLAVLNSTRSLQIMEK